MLFTEPFGGTQPVRSIFSHYLTQTKALVFYYLKLALIPVGLNVDRDYPVSSAILEGRVIVSLLVLTCLAVLLIRVRRQRVVLFSSLWFPAGLLLTTYGVLLHQVVNEHRVYLSLAGLCALAALLLYKFLASLPLRISDLSIGTRSGTALTTALVVIVLMTFGSATIIRNQVWSSGLTLWKDASRNGGMWRAHMNYGLELEAEGAQEQALAQLEKAVELGPYAFAHLNLGNAYVKRGQQDRGFSHLKTAVRLFPSSPETHLYLAYGLRTGGGRRSKRPKRNFARPWP